MDSLELKPARRAAGTVRLPGSKSISNRVLLLAALARGEPRSRACSTPTTRASCASAVAPWVFHSSDNTVKGVGGPFPVKKAELFLGNAGTAFRPLTAALALSGGEYRLSGVPRMHERPIGDLVDALRGIGARIDYAGKEGFPPLAVHPGSIRLDKPVKVRGDVSSQFLTALLMALPLAASDSTIEVEGELISKPYVEITLNVMQRFGVSGESARLALISTFPRGRTSSPERSSWKAMPRRLPTSSPPARSAAGRCASRASGGAASRATCASPRCWSAWARAFPCGELRSK